MNPFEGTKAPITSRAELIGRKEAFRSLEKKMNNHAPTVVMGVEGSGKSSLLNSFFDNNYRMMMAREKQTLIGAVTAYPTTISDSEEIYDFFVDRANETLWLLNSCGMTEMKNAVEKNLETVGNSSGASRFEGTVNAFAACGLRLVFVLDNFEQFTTSKLVTMQHHENMRSLLGKLQYVVATNYDFNKDSLPPEVQSSYLLQMFADNKIVLQGFSEEESEQYIRNELGESDLEFSSELIRELHVVSGGFPKLLHKVAFHAYECIEQEDIQSIKGTNVAQSAFADLKAVMDRWCRLLTPNQIKVLKELKSMHGQPAELDKSAADLLLQRGVLREVYRINERGRKVRETGLYDYNSVLFSSFCTRTESDGMTLMEKAAQKNPFHAEKAKPHELIQKPAAEPPKPPLEEVLKKGLTEGTVVVNGDIIMPGANKSNTEIHVEQMTLLQSMGDGAQLLEAVSQIVGRIEEDNRFTVDKTLDTGTLDLRYDEKANEVADQFLPMKEPTKEELQSLDERFAEVRATRPEVTDAFLDTLSFQCQFYLKIAVVVENALQILHKVRLGDFSAQLVMYGKVLEQCLRDNMYQLFSTESELKDWDLYKHISNAGSKQSFGGMQVNFSFIGNYIHMIRYKRNYLSELCKNNNIHNQELQTQTQDEWVKWWKKLHDDVDAARTCRNSADHAGTQSEKDDLKVMCNLLFGSNGIMKRCTVADQLYQKITQ